MDNIRDQNEIDESLLRKIASGNDEAFTELYYATSHRLYGFFLSLTKNKEDAEDLMQNTYIKIRNSAHLYQRQGTPMAWIFTVSKNLFLDFVRRENRHKTIDITEVQNYIPQSSEHSVAESVENKMVLEVALSVLDEQECSILILHLVGGLKYREISGVVGLPQNTVITKYHRALKKMRKYLQSEGGHDERKRFTTKTKSGTKSNDS